jgi:hypothetical protein
MPLHFFVFAPDITAALTSGRSRASKRSLVVRILLSGPVACSGARRQGKVLDEVSAAVHGDVVAMNMMITGLDGELSCWRKL